MLHENKKYSLTIQSLKDHVTEDAEMVPMLIMLSQQDSYLKTTHALSYHPNINDRYLCNSPSIFYKNQLSKFQFLISPRALSFQEKQLNNILS